MPHRKPQLPPQPHKPHLPQVEDLDEPEPADDLPEQGLVPPLISDDPEHDRLVDPEGLPQ